ncbi:DNA repair protein RecO [Oceanivirga salmonicida]|uniref:DNA repair protein RecO n=1 Tax=Oceanivirga salmonicida TaxID=1769291 RepID=UPI000834BF8B|nr:DNA repair protein RecO [Oceanivirga salmonicida]
MEILKDEALVLKRKNVNESNVSISLFTKKYGKINAIAYGVRSTNKKEKISLNPISYIECELKKTNDNYILMNYNMKIGYNKIYSNIDKLQMAMYVVYTLNKILTYSVVEHLLYDRVEKVLNYLENIDNSLLKSENFNDKFLNSYLKKVMLDIGIYDNSINFKTLKNIEKYINDYLGVDIDYTQIMIGVGRNANK